MDMKKTRVIALNVIFCLTVLIGNFAQEVKNEKGKVDGNPAINKTKTNSSNLAEEKSKVNSTKFNADLPSSNSKSNSSISKSVTPSVNSSSSKDDDLDDKVTARNSDTEPKGFENQLGISPKLRFNYEIFFLVYYGDNRYRNISRESSLFRNLRRRNTVIIIPGFYSDGYMEKVKMAFGGVFSLTQFNVVIVEWHYIKNGDYQPAQVKDALNVGSILAGTIKEMERRHIKVERIITHGTGGIVAGRLGKIISLRRVMALDPFISGLDLGRDTLSRKTAHLVEVIHTSIGEDGVSQRLGHRDFYLNEGRSPQAPCRTDDPEPYCSSRYAMYVYARAIAYPEKPYLYATLCSNWGNYINSQCDNEPTLYLFNTQPKSQSPQGKYYALIPDSTSFN